MNEEKGYFGIPHKDLITEGYDFDGCRLVNRTLSAHDLAVIYDKRITFSWRGVTFGFVDVAPAVKKIREIESIEKVYNVEWWQTEPDPELMRLQLAITETTLQELLQKNVSKYYLTHENGRKVGNTIYKYEIIINHI